jgi:hypothetical protein
MEGHLSPQASPYLFQSFKGQVSDHGSPVARPAPHIVDRRAGAGGQPGSFSEGFKADWMICKIGFRIGGN